MKYTEFCGMHSDHNKSALWGSQYYCNNYVQTGSKVIGFQLPKTSTPPRSRPSQITGILDTQASVLLTSWQWTWGGYHSWGVWISIIRFFCTPETNTNKFFEKVHLHAETRPWVSAPLQVARPRPLPSSFGSGLVQAGEENRPAFLRGLVLALLQAPLSPFFLPQWL